MKSVRTKIKVKNIKKRGLRTSFQGKKSRRVCLGKSKEKVTEQKKFQVRDS